MKTSSLALLVFVIAGTPVLNAQKIGDAPSSVEAALGKPGSKISRGNREIWLYPDGKKIVLSAGVVSQIEILPPAAPPAKPTPVSPKPSPNDASASASETPSRMNRDREVPISAAPAPSAPQESRVIFSAIGHELKLPPGYRIESQRDFAGEMSAFQSMGTDETYLGGGGTVLGNEPIGALQFATSGGDALKEGATVETIDGWKIYVWTFENNKKEKVKSFRALKVIDGVGFTIAMIAPHHRADAVLKKELVACLSSIKATPRK